MIGFSNLLGPLVHSVLYPRRVLYPRLALKRFRGERDISGFVWLFTPIHRSSPNFSTLVSSALHVVLPTLQPAHGWLTRFRVYNIQLNRPVQTRFPFGYRYNPLTLLDIITRWLIIQKARRRPEQINGLRQFVNVRFQVYFTPLHGVLFTFPSRYWFTIGHQQYLALGDGPPRFRQGFTCPVVLR